MHPRDWKLTSGGDNVEDLIAMPARFFVESLSRCIVNRRGNGKPYVPNCQRIVGCKKIGESSQNQTVVRWFSTAAGEVRQGPESARLHHLFGVKAIPIERASEKAAFILEQLEQHLSDRLWLELDRPTIADIAVFPYVALAGDRGSSWRRTPTCAPGSHGSRPCRAMYR